MDEDQAQPEPKISIVVGILGTTIAVFLDLLSLVPFVGDVEEIPAGMILIANVIFGMGSVVLITQGVVMLLKAIPVVQEFPLWTPAWLFIWFIENHPSELTSKVDRAAAIAGALEGEVGGVEGAAAEGAATVAETAETAAQAAEVGSEAAAAAGTEAAAAGEAAGYVETETEKGLGERTSGKTVGNEGSATPRRRSGGGRLWIEPGRRRSRGMIPTPSRFVILEDMKRVGLLRIFLPAFFVVFGVVSGAMIANAQTTSGPQFLLTWQASNSYVPSFYKDKALPGIGSRITAALDLVSQGKIVNLKGQTIYWYLNGIYIGGGTGVQEITFSPNTGAPDDLSLQVKLPSYNGTLLIHTIAIPVAEPIAVIVSPYPQGRFSGNSVSLQAEAYFFNAPSLSSLVFNWSANGQAANNTEDPSAAQIDIPAGSPAGSALNVSLDIANPLDSTTASASENLVYQP